MPGRVPPAPWRGRRRGCRGSRSSSGARGYRRAFKGFDAERIARYGEKDVERLMADAGIIRNRAKIESTVKNARATKS